MTEDIFKDAEIKKEALMREFEELPETTIIGVVGARDPGAGFSEPPECNDVRINICISRG